MSDVVAHFIATILMPISVAIFLTIVGYAAWPKNQKQYDEAASLPLRED